jgi:excisionase family DNA binding protein
MVGVTARLLTLSEVAEELRCSERTVKRRIAEGALPVARIGGRPLVRRSDLDSFVLRSVRRESASGSLAGWMPGSRLGPGQRLWDLPPQ